VALNQQALVGDLPLGSRPDDATDDNLLRMRFSVYHDHLSAAMMS
jgi:hypothetical protein